MELKLTILIRDEAPLRHMNEPVSLRSVIIELTEEQQYSIRLLHPDEAISHCFLEPK